MRVTTLASRIVLLGIIVVLASLAIEAGLHLYYSDRNEGQGLMMVDEYPSPFVFKGIPDSSFVEAGIEYRLNNLGMRREAAVSETPSPDVLRILSYGDSIANGWGVASDRTYAHRVESRLNGQGPGRVEVLNMYRGGSPTLASFHIRADVPRLEPHAVLLEIELLNDTSDEALLETRGRDVVGLPLEVVRGRYILGYDTRLLAPIAISGSFVERTKTWAAVSHLAGSVLSLAAEGSVKSSIDPLFLDRSGTPHYFYNLGFDRFLLTEQALERGFDQMFESLAGIHRFLHRSDVHLLVMILPSKYAFADSPFRPAARSLVARSEERAEELDLPFLSVLESMESMGGEELFMDFCHPTAEGNGVIANQLIPALQEWRSRRSVAGFGKVELDGGGRPNREPLISRRQVR